MEARRNVGVAHLLGLFFLVITVCLSAVNASIQALTDDDHKSFEGSIETSTFQTARSSENPADSTFQPTESPAEETVIMPPEQLSQELSAEETVNTDEQLPQSLPAEDNILNDGPIEENTVTNPSSIIESKSGLIESHSSVNANDDISKITNSSISINNNGPTLDGSTLSGDSTPPSSSNDHDNSSGTGPTSPSSSNNHDTSSDIGTTSPSPTNDTSSDIGTTSPSPTNDTSSDIGTTSPSPTNDTSSDIGTTSPSPTNDTSSDIGTTSPSPTNDTSLNIVTHSLTNGSTLTLGGFSSDTPSGILSSSDPNAVVHEIHPGNSQFTFRDISDNTNSTKNAKIKFNKPGGYNIGDNATVTITDKSANLDPEAINTVLVGVSSSSDKFGILVLFTETGTNTGVFTGKFLITDGPSSFGPLPSIRTKTGDNIKVLYVASHARLKATIDGVTEGGEVTVTDFALSSLQRTFVDFNPIGNGATLTFTDVKTNPNSNITITMSYADSNIVGTPLDEFQILMSNDGDSWTLVDNLADPKNGRPTIDKSSKTVTVTTALSDTSVPIIFMLGQCSGCGSGGFGSPGGGGGGGVPLPGNGIVFDFLAPVVALPPSPPTPPSPTPNPPISNTPPSGEPLAFRTLSGSSNTAALFPASLSTVNSSTEQVINTSSVLGQVSDSKSDTLKAANFTVVLYQIGTVVLVFTNLLSQGPIDVTPIQSPSGLSALKIEQTSDALKPMRIKIDNSTYSIVGTPLQIGPPSVNFDGRLTVSVPYNARLAGETDEVRLLYSDGGNWEDLTSGVNPQKHYVVGDLESLGIVIAATKSIT